MSYLNQSTLSEADRTVYERGVWRWAGQLQDQAQAGIPVANLTTVTLEIRDAKTGELLVSGRDVKNANNGTIDSSGNMTLIIAGADNKVVNPRLEREAHLVTIDYTWEAGARRHWHTIELFVVNHPGIA